MGTVHKIVKNADFEWKSGARFKGDAQLIGGHLEWIRKMHGGMITARMVVEDARSQGSPLHDLFEWNDRKAAEKQRLSTAASLIGALVQVQVEDVEPVRYYARVTVEAQDEDEKVVQSGYISMREALTHRSTREQVVTTAMAELEAFQRKYRLVRELAEIFAAIRKVKSRRKK